MSLSYWNEGGFQQQSRYRHDVEKNELLIESLIVSIDRFMNIKCDNFSHLNHLKCILPKCFA